MSRCPGLHCDGCNNSGGGWLLVVLVLIAIIGAALHAAWHTITATFDTVGHTAATAFSIAIQVVAYTAATAAGLLILTGAVRLAARIHTRARVRALAVPRPRTVITATVQRPAIEQPRPRLTVVRDTDTTVSTFPAGGELR